MDRWIGQGILLRVGSTDAYVDWWKALYATLEGSVFVDATVPARHLGISASWVDPVSTATFHGVTTARPPKPEATTKASVERHPRPAGFASSRAARPDSSTAMPHQLRDAIVRWRSHLRAPFRERGV